MVDFTTLQYCKEPSLNNAFKLFFKQNPSLSQLALLFAHRTIHPFSIQDFLTTEAAKYQTISNLLIYFKLFFQKMRFLK